MRGVILAGGKGTRLKPLSDVTNKHLVGVYDRPMIEYPLRTLTEMGIHDILVVSGREHAGHFLSYLGSGKKYGVNLTFKVQEDAGGIADALRLAEDFCSGDQLAVILGDNYFDARIYPMQEMSNTINHAGIVLARVPDPERFGVAQIQDGVIRGIVEKPKEPVGDLAVTGLYFYPPDVFDVIRTLRPSDRGEFEITDVNNWYIASHRMTYTEYEGFWSDMGTHKSLARTVEHILKL